MLLATAAAVAQPPSPPGHCFLRAKHGATDVYVGQPVPYILILYRRITVRNVSLELPENDGLVITRIGDPVEIQRVENGLDYQVMEIRHTITARRPGRFCVGPARMRLTALAPLGAKGRPFNHDPFFDKSPANAVTVESEALVLNVAALPEAGRPDDFTGLVGRFDLVAELSPRTVAVGESATLTVRIIGVGDPRRIPDPPLPALEGLRLYADRPDWEESTIDGLPAGTRTRCYALVPQVAGTVTIPSLSLNYFDPQQGDYVVGRTPPLVLFVRPPPADTTAAPRAPADARRPGW